jgi:hypothetical protein
MEVSMDEVTLKPPAEKGPEVGPETGLEEIDFAPLADYFDLEGPVRSQSEQNSLRSIYQWLTSQGVKEKGDMLAKLRSLELQLGTPDLGEKRLNRLVRVIEIDRQVEDLMKERSAYVRNG